MRSSYTRSRSASWESVSGCERRGGDVATDLGDVAGARDDGGDAGLVDHPAQGEGRRGDVGSGDLGDLPGRGDADVERDAGERLADVEGLPVPVEVPVVVGGERRRLVVLAGEQAAGQRHAGEDADPGLRGGRQQLLQRLAPEDVEDDLDALHARVLRARSCPRRRSPPRRRRRRSPPRRPARRGCRRPAGRSRPPAAGSAAARGRGCRRRGCGGTGRSRPAGSPACTGPPRTGRRGGRPWSRRTAGPSAGRAPCGCAPPSARRRRRRPCRAG